jgi:hypothetical protein
MAKFLRIFIALIVVLSLTLLAKNNSAWAANPGADANQSSLVQAEQSLSAKKDDDCKDKDKDKKEKHDDKDKDKCDDDDDGTVQPPGDVVRICKPGNYSVGGVATLDVKNVHDQNRQGDDCFRARAESSEDVSGLPNNAGTVVSDLVVLTSVEQASNIKVCFAAPPGTKKLKIFYFADHEWKAVGTPVKNGMACGNVQRSGSYVLTSR